MTDEEGRASAVGEHHPPPARVRVPLRTINEVQRELARLYREMRTGRIGAQDGSRLANVLSILSRVIAGSDLEARIAEIEEQMRKRR
ncbi:MAG: hypothetical protein Q7J47_06025 [Azoarcus sp.]|nr:hypothetical protein [Azoarcus sp.]